MQFYKIEDRSPSEFMIIEFGCVVFSLTVVRVSPKNAVENTMMRLSLRPF